MSAGLPLLFSSARFCPCSFSALARRLDPLLQLPASGRGRGDSHFSRRLCLEAPILGQVWRGRLGSQSPGSATARAGGGSPGPSRSLPPRAPPRFPMQPLGGTRGAASRCRRPTPRTRSRLAFPAAARPPAGLVPRIRLCDL